MDSPTRVLGTKFDRLRGQENYAIWAREFQPIAKLHEAWDLLRGVEPVLPKPQLALVFDPPPPKAKAKSRKGADQTIIDQGTSLQDRGSRRGSTASATGGRSTSMPPPPPPAQDDETTEPVDDAKALQYRIAKYNLELSEWKDNNKRARFALALLQAAIEPYLRTTELEDETDPAVAWALVKSRNKMSDTRLLDVSFTKLEALQLDQFNNIHDYINAHLALSKDIQAAGGSYPDTQLVNKMLRLPSRFKPLKTIVNYQLSLGAKTSLADFCDILAQYVVDHQEEWDKQDKANKDKSQRKAANVPNTATTTTTTLTATPKTSTPRPRCTYEKCGRWGHVEADCRTKARDLANQDKKPGDVAALSTNTDNHDHDDAVEHIAAMSLHDEYLDLSTYSMSDLSLAPNNADFCQTSFDKLHGELAAGDGEGLRLHEDWEALSLHGVHRSDCAFALLSDEFKSVPKHQWVADSAATTHVCNDRSLFTTYTARTSGIGSCDGSATLRVEGFGTVDMWFLSPTDRKVHVTLSSVSYAPGSRCNLLSLPMLADKAGVTFYADKQQLTLYNSAKRSFAIAPRQFRLYCLRLHQVGPANQTPAVSGPASVTNGPSNSTLGTFTHAPQRPTGHIAAAAVDFNDPVWHKHRCLGHPSLDVMRKMVKVCEGLGLTDEQIKAKLLDVCPVCATSRALNRIPRDPAKRRYTNPGDLVHIDTWGPYAIPGLKGERYFILYTDDATRYTWVDFLITKDGVAPVSTERLRRIETTHNIKIRRIRTDNEYLQLIFSRYCADNGITHENTVPYAHHQVGVGERANRTIRERAAASIQDANPTSRITEIVIGKATQILRSATLPEGLWTEAVRDAVWKKNRAPTKALKFKKTPYEALTGNKPNLSHEHAWGSRVYVTIPPEQRAGPKLHTPRGYVAYFVASESEQIYRIWNPELEKVVRMQSARVDDTAGTEDPQPGVQLNDRDPDPPVDLPTDHQASDEEDGSSSEDDDENDEAPPARERQIHLDNEPNLPERDDTVVISHHFAAMAEGTQEHTSPSEPRLSKGAVQQLRLNLWNITPFPTDDQFAALSEAAGPAGLAAPGNKFPMANHWRFFSDRRKKWDTNVVPPGETTLQLYNRKLVHYHNMEVGTLIPILGERGIPSTIYIAHRDAATVLAAQEVYGDDHPLITTKCFACYMNGKGSCTGTTENPCKSCSEAVRPRFCQSLQRAYHRSLNRRCTHCISQGGRCGPDSPCESCVRSGWACTRTDKDRAMVTRHVPEGQPLPIEDTDDCDSCRFMKWNCGGFDDGPCYKCCQHGKICAYSNIGDRIGKAYISTAYEWKDSDDGETFYRVQVPYDSWDEDKPRFQAAWTKRGAEAFRATLKDANINKNLSLMDEDGENDLDGGIPDDAFDDVVMMATSATHSLIMAEDEPLDDDIAHVQLLNLDDDEQLDADLKHYTMLAKSEDAERMPRNYREAMRLPDAKQWDACTWEEFKRLEALGVFTVVALPKGARVLSTRMVYKKKYRPTGEVKSYKARCVARGFMQKKGLDYVESWAGTANSTAIRVLIALAVIHGWLRFHVDIMTAFLYALLEEELYAQPPFPIQLPPGHVWKLKRALYGLVQSPRAWFRKLKAEMLKMGFRQSPYEPCIYIHVLSSLRELGSANSKQKC